MLDRSSQLAVPDESYFIPQLANRHGGRLDLPEFLDDLRRIGTLRDWGVPVEAVRKRLADGSTLSEGIAAVYETYAEQQGKPRWGDKTPMYMQHLGLLERLFPHALYLHLIRDGRDAAVSFLAMPPGIVTETWAHPRGAAGFAAQWRTEVRAARRLGRRLGADRYLEVRYEDLVRDPESELRRIGDFAGIPFETAMLEYKGSIDLSAKPHQQSLAKPPTPGLRDWRTELSPEDLAAFEGIAGDLLAELDYEVATPDGRAAPRIGARARLASYAARVNAWRTAGLLVRKSPLWRRRHPALS